ncbi:phosphoribosyltransferase [Streptomyces sp. NPDC002187]|uniref:phosphoribosyltransferase n=1 Tax=Streptomyces sp. NPDC002187 TaxID=3364637 RepID=UPI0036C614AD
MRFADRRAAGRELAARLVEKHRGGQLPDPFVLALPRGGVPVGDEVAKALGAPLDVLVVRMIGAPFNPELGIGALVDDDPPLYDEQALAMLDLTPDRLGAQVARERVELNRREDLYRGRRPAPDLRGRTVIVVDEGLATGVSVRAALTAVRADEPGRVVVAVPVCSTEAYLAISTDIDELVHLHRPLAFRSVGEWYDDFGQVGDDEVVRILRAAFATHRHAVSGPAPRAVR